MLSTVILSQEKLLIGCTGTESIKVIPLSATQTPLINVFIIVKEQRSSTIIKSASSFTRTYLYSVYNDERGLYMLRVTR